MALPRVVAFSGNTHRPSKTRTLVEAIAAVASTRASLDIRRFDIVDAGPGLGSAWARDALPLPARRVVEAIENADALIVGTPVYKGAYAGLFKHLFDLVDPEALANKPVILAATGGGPRHALVVEHALRPLFGFFGALSLPTAIYACDADFLNGELTDDGVRQRISAAAGELIDILTTERRPVLSFDEVRAATGQAR